MKSATIALLTKRQRSLLLKGFRLGLSDVLLAERLNLSSHQVYIYRRSKNISAKDVTENRLDSWADMIKKGINLDLISAMYKVKPASIRQMLWRERQFSFRQAKDEMRVADAAKKISEIEKTTIKLLGL